MRYVSWQQRYKASVICTIKCKMKDTTDMLGKVIATVGKCNANIGSIRTAGVEGDCKLRNIEVYCSDKKHFDTVLNAVKAAGDIEVLGIRNEIFESHRRGSIDIVSRMPIKTVSDLRKVYTPGVASVCNEIVADNSKAWEYTGICDRVAIVTNGTAVLGLGAIGVLGSLPVMEGKAAIFAEFAKISAVPFLVDSKIPDEIVDVVCKTAGSYGAIQLEDISAPACFEIEDKLKQRLNIPVFHDDQHGTATVSLAALINALEYTKRKPQDCTAIMLGAGAAGYAITMMLLEFGIKDIIVYDSAGAIYKGRTEKMNPYKQKLAEITNKQNIKGSLLEGFKGRDIFVGVAQPNMVSQDMIRVMAKDAIALPLSNPVGEISVEEALEAGVAIAADGRGINNALAYPGIFRGALDVKATDITMDMKLAAAKKLAELTPQGDLLPDMLDMNVHKQVAEAVAAAWKK